MSQKSSSLDIEGKVGSFELPSSLLFYIKDEKMKETVLHHIVDKYQISSQDEVHLVADEKKSKKGAVTIGAMREFIKKISLTPVGPVRLGIIESAESMTTEAANALLKTLEEPPRNALLTLFIKVRLMLLKPFSAFITRLLSSAYLVLHLLRWANNLPLACL